MDDTGIWGNSFCKNRRQAYPPCQSAFCLNLLFECFTSHLWAVLRFLVWLFLRAVRTQMGSVQFITVISSMFLVILTGFLHSRWRHEWKLSVFDVFFLEGKKKVIGFNVILTVYYLLNHPGMLISLFICFLVSQIEYVKPNPKPLILLAVRGKV